MSRRFVRRPLPLRLLAVGAVAGSFALAPPADAQIGPATAEQSDAPEPRFGMFRDPAGYEGAERRDPIDYNGELLIAGDEELTLSVWKGVNGEEAMERDAAADGAAVNRGDAPIRRGADGAGPDAPGDIADARRRPAEQRVPVGPNARVFLNGERATMADLRPGDRVRVRGVDRDGSGVSRIVALRTDEFSGNNALDIAPDIDSRAATGAAPADVPAGAAGGRPPAGQPRTGDGEAGAPSAASIKRAAETGVTSPDGGGVTSVETRLTDDAKERVAERRNSGAVIGGPAAGGGAQPPADGKKAPGFGFVVSDSPGEGVLIADVQPGGPAADAGLRQGDFLTRMAGQSVQEPADVKKLASDKMSKEKPEDGARQPVPVTVWRDGGTKDFEITPSESARDYYPRSARDAMGGARRDRFEPSIGMRTRDNDNTGVDILAGVATGALAAEAADDGGAAPGGYGSPYGFYGDDLVDGVGVFDDSLYGGGYGYGTPGARGYNLREERLENEVLRRRMFEARANAASGLDAEDYFSGSYPGGDDGGNDRLRPGDRVIGVDDRPVADAAEMRRAIRDYSGNTLKLNVIRNGQRQNLFLPKRQAAAAAAK